MTITFNDGLQMIKKLNAAMAADCDRHVLFQFDIDDPDYFHFSNAAYLIEHLVSHRTTASQTKAKKVARLLNTLLREGDDLLRNAVLVGTLESFKLSEQRPHISTDDIASVMQEPLRGEYLKEMGEHNPN